MHFLTCHTSTYDGSENVLIKREIHEARKEKIVDYMLVKEEST